MEVNQEHYGGGWTLIVKLFPICSVFSQTDWFMESNLIPDKGNIWEYLVWKVLNTTDLCVAGGKSVRIF